MILACSVLSEGELVVAPISDIEYIIRGDQVVAGMLVNIGRSI